MEERYYLLKIRLIDIEPEIWRRFVVPGTITLDRLHDVIQIVMGWTDSHLHTFSIGGKDYVEMPEDFGIEEGKYHLVDLIKKKGRTFTYEYDYGDSWKHEILIEDSNFNTLSLLQPIQCMEGERACPPEDVGSTSGYADFCKAIADPKHGEHKHLKKWYSELGMSTGEYDPEAFDINRINIELMRYMRWSRTRFIDWEVDMGSVDIIF